MSTAHRQRQKAIRDIKRHYPSGVIPKDHFEMIQEHWRSLRTAGREK